MTISFGGIPFDMSLHGMRVTTQGFCGDTPRGFLSNAVEHRVNAYYYH